jgi:hypothetical protein
MAALAAFAKIYLRGVLAIRTAIIARLGQRANTVGMLTFIRPLRLLYLFHIFSFNL